MEEKRWDELIDATSQNATLIKEHREATEKLIDLYNTGVSGIRIASWVGRFAKWMAGLVIFATAYHYLIEHFTNGSPPP